MSEGPSQEFRFDENDYARPNQPWQCGWAAEGHACPLGPTGRGHCRTAHECSPYQQGDTWVCARTKAQGGKCDEGPLPDGTCCKNIQKCQPVRSVLSRRGVVSFTVFAVAVASGLLILGMPTRSDLASPGALSSSHSQVVDRCEQCHTSASDGPTAWARNTLDETAGLQQIDRCLACHSDLGPDAKQPHGQTFERLAQLTASRSSTEGEKSPHGVSTEIAMARALLSPAPDSHAGLACATCHREHRGPLADLAELTNQQCQVCHVDAFHGFSAGHPEFTAYPYERRTRLYFDHLSHFGEHFEDAETKRNRMCSDCHQTDSAGRYMLVKEFRTTCAECHSHQIHDDTTLGIAAISLPALDVDALVNNGRQIGEWPREYPLHVEASSSITPLQRLLLRSYDGYPAIEAALSNVDLRDLQDADTPQLQSAEMLVWLLKESLYDIVQQGQPEIHRRLAIVLDGLTSEEQIITLANSFPIVPTIRMQQAWLPSLQSEVEAYRASSELPELPETSAPATAASIRKERHESKLLASGWYLHGSSLSLRYRPIGHADPLLRTLLDLGAKGLSTASESPPIHSTLKELFEQVSSPFAAGRCTKCHSVDTDETAVTAVNWNSYQPPVGQHGFTRFSHAPHVTLLSDDACSKCHPFNNSPPVANSVFQPEFIDRNWHPVTNSHKFDSNFVPMTQSGCAECHAENSTRDRCLTCHNYHVR